MTEKKKQLVKKIYEIANHIPRLIHLRDAWESGTISHDEFITRTSVVSGLIHRLCTNFK